MEIVFEDKDLIVCIKDAGILSENGGMPELLKERTGAGEIYCIHRLDRDVGGLMVYAKTRSAAAKLTAAVAERKLTKTYLAVVEGVPEPSGELRDLLFHDAAKNKTYVVRRERKGVKEALLDYETLGTKSGLSLVRITLRTGRSHQIRVQFASRKMPLLGDRKYGSSHTECRIALWAHALSFPHPATGRLLTFSSPAPSIYPFTEFQK